MKKTVCKFLLLLGMLPIISCTSELEFYPIELSTEGIDFVKVNQLTLSTEIPSDGINFSITGVGEYADRICVSDVTIDGSVQNNPTLPITSFDGDWGSFNQNGNTIDFVITPNNGSAKRILDFTIGGGYWVRYLRLTQSSN
ncbi:MAG: hypothetical protein IKY67_06940 [Paludibacteraceae bacterium]|nr:hypothetical protein [Paludibacteraceae bacterium]